MTGEVAGLFPKDELDGLLNDLRPALKAECPGGDWKGELNCSVYCGYPLLAHCYHCPLHPLVATCLTGVPDTWDNLYSFFLGRVRDRLHVVLCFSPVGKRFARWAQQFPGLISGCTCDWWAVGLPGLHILHDSKPASLHPAPRVS